MPLYGTVAVGHNEHFSWHSLGGRPLRTPASVRICIDSKQANNHLVVQRVVEGEL